MLAESLPCIQMYNSGTWEGTSLSCRFEIVTSSLAIGWPACYMDNSYSYSEAQIIPGRGYPTIGVP